MTLDTKDDRTLFFDMMPVFFSTPGGVKVKIKLYTAPGQVMHESTRRIVLQGSDAVVFVADGRKSEASSTLAYWKDMVRNLEANGLDPRSLPIVIQKNKMDLEGVREDDFTDIPRSPRVPVVPAKAIQGEGVLETLGALLALCYRDLDRSLGLSKRFALLREGVPRGGALPRGSEMKVQQSVLLQPTPLGDLLDLRSFSEVCQSFAELYRIGVKVFDDGREQAGGREDRQRRLLRLPLADARRAQPVHGHRAAGEDRPVARGGGPHHRPLLRRVPLRRPAGPLRGGRHRPHRLRPVRARRPGGPPRGARPALPGLRREAGRLLHEQDPAGAAGHRREGAAPLRRDPRRARLHRAQEPAHRPAAHRGGAGVLPRGAGEEPAARGGLPGAAGARPAQVELPRHHEPRAAHAAHQRHRLLRDDAGGAGRAAHRRAARVPPDHHGQGGEPPRAHHLHPRHLQD